MRPYSHYLSDFIAETYSGPHHLAGSTPPVIPKLAKAAVKISLDPNKGAELTLNVKKFLAKAHKSALEDVTLVPGSTQACFQTLAAITEPGDSIVIEHPGYEPYLAAAKFLGLNILRYHRSQDFEREFKEIKSLARTAKVLLISNPHCPTGWVYTPGQLARFAELDLITVVDEVFLPMFAKGTISNRPALPVSENLIFLSGLSKPTGLGITRTGWIVAAPVHTQKIFKVGLHLHLQMPQPLVQVADYIFKNWMPINRELLKIANENRKPVLKFANKHPAVLSNDFKIPFFAMMKVPPAFKDASVFTQELLNHDIFVRDGAYFEMPDAIRIHCMLPKKAWHKVFAKIASYY